MSSRSHNGVARRKSVAERPLPARAIGRVSKLAYLLHDNRPLYAKMLNYVRAGAYLHVAAAAIGVAPETISRWLAKGERAKSGHYSQFRQDILAAVAEASVIAESELKSSKPETWLRCGPRRLLGDEWRDAADQQPTTVVDVSMPVPPPSLADLAAAMVELAKAGVCLPAAAVGYAATDGAALGDLDQSAVLTPLQRS
jgi:hypothetical protein